ncbi:MULTISPECIES: hypothetical protein [Spirulina sp. CCY15215]|nr:hypothetical protein [Spirulina major]
MKERREKAHEKSDRYWCAIAPVPYNLQEFVISKDRDRQEYRTS